MKYQMWSIRFHVYSSVPAIIVQRYTLLRLFIYLIFLPFFVLSAAGTEWRQGRWDCCSERHSWGVLGWTQKCPEALWQCWVLAGKGRRGHRDTTEVSAGEVTAEIAWAVSRSAWDHFCNVLVFLQHQQAVLQGARSGFVSPARGKEGAGLHLQDSWNVGEQGLVFLLGLSRVNCQCLEIKRQSLHRTENFFLFFLLFLPLHHNLLCENRGGTVRAVCGEGLSPCLGAGWGSTPAESVSDAVEGTWHSHGSSVPWLCWLGRGVCSKGNVH